MPAISCARKYEEVWQLLKKRELVRLKVNKALVTRVKRGLSKEKDADVHFKILNDHDHYRLSMKYSKDTEILTITLEGVIGLEDRKDIREDASSFIDL